MNKFMTVFLSSTLFATSSFAGFGGAVLEKTVSPGFMAPEFAESLQCSVFFDRVEIKRSFGEVLVTETKQVQLTPSIFTAIHKLVKAKEAGHVISSQGPMDAPSIIYSATEILPNDGVNRVDFLVHGEINSQIQDTAGDNLKAVLDVLCE